MRYSLGAILFAGVFDRYPRLNVGSVEHETMWIPHWLQQMDFTYRERPVFTKGWKSRPGYGCGAKATVALWKYVTAGVVIEGATMKVA